MSDGPIVEFWETGPLGFFQDLVLEIEINLRFPNVKWWAANATMYYSNYGGIPLENFSAVMVPPSYVWLLNVSPVPTSLGTDVYPWAPSSYFFVFNASSDLQNLGTYVEYFVQYIRDGEQVVCEPLQCWTFPQYSWFYPNPSDTLVQSVLANPSASSLVKAISQRQGPRYLGLNPLANQKPKRAASNSKKVVTLSDLRAVTKDEMIGDCNRIHCAKNFRLVNRSMMKGCLIHLPLPPASTATNTTTKTTNASAGLESDETAIALQKTTIIPSKM